MVPNARTTSPDGYSKCGCTRQLVTFVHLLTKHLLLNCKMVPNARATLSDGYSECGDTKATSDTCTSLTKYLLLNCEMVPNACATSPLMDTPNV